jgi:hypothetical protein
MRRREEEMKLGANSKEDLLKLLELSSGLIAALDGLWFLTVEGEYGHSQALRLDVKVWEKYAHIVVKRMRRMLGLSKKGIEGLKEFIAFDPLLLIFDYQVVACSDKRMLLRMNRCPVLEAMERTGREKSVCESTTGLYFKNLGKEIDPRLVVHPLKLPPRDSPQDVCCEWLFELQIDRS